MESMKKLMKRFFVTLLTIIITFISTSTAVFAEADSMLKNKTNKLKLCNTVKEGSKKN